MKLVPCSKSEHHGHHPEHEVCGLCDTAFAADGYYVPGKPVILGYDEAMAKVQEWVNSNYPIATVPDDDDPDTDVDNVMHMTWHGWQPCTD